MLRILAVIALLAISNIVAAPTQLETPKIAYSEVIITDVIETPEIINQTEYVWNLVNKKADEYGVDSKEMWETVKCECPDLLPDCPSRVKRKDGTYEPSFGLVQIHLPDHPQVTYEQAIDPEFAIDFMAKYFKKGYKSWWSCFTILKNRGTL